MRKSGPICARKSMARCNASPIQTARRALPSSTSQSLLFPFSAGSNFSVAHIQPNWRIVAGIEAEPMISSRLGRLGCVMLGLAALPLWAEQEHSSAPHSIQEGTTFLVRLEEKL